MSPTSSGAPGLRARRPRPAVARPERPGRDRADAGAGPRSVRQRGRPSGGRAAPPRRTRLPTGRDLVEHRRVVQTGEAGHRHQHRAARLAQHVGEFLGPVQEVERDGDGAGPRDRELHRRELQAVGHDHPDPVPRLHAEATSPRRAAATTPRLGVGVRPVVGHHHRPVGELLGAGVEEAGEGSRSPLRERASSAARRWSTEPRIASSSTCELN